MPWGYECRAKLLKQMPAKPAVRRGKVALEVSTPSPAEYEPPGIFCGPGFSKIKRAPAYTFGHLTPVSYAKPVAKANAPMFNVQGLSRTGRYRIKQGVVSPQLDPVGDKTKTPGAAAYAPPLKFLVKRPPTYSIRKVPKPTYEPWDMWTPPPNMYCPPIRGKKSPAYTLGNAAKADKIPDIPGPGGHEPNFNYVKKNKPAFSFAGPFRHLRAPRIPAPNTYCEKKFMVSKRTIPAPTFGIRHSDYIGVQNVYLKAEKLDFMCDDS